jgi:hypothetical protein
MAAIATCFAVANCSGLLGSSKGLPALGIKCEVGPDCDAKWSRAKAWVAANSPLKIAKETVTIIQTVSSPADGRETAFTITRNTTTKLGVDEIDFVAGCGSTFSCIPNIAESRAKFTAFVAAGP